MPFVTVDGSRIYYETHGAGPALMLVHGSGGHHAIWWQQVPYFARHFTVVLPTLRGFGKSDSVPDGPDAQEFHNDLRAVLEDAKIERAVILGQSIGALPALKLAVAHPERVAGVVLAHSLGGIDDPELKQLAAADRGHRSADEQGIPTQPPRADLAVQGDGNLQPRQDAGPAQSIGRRPFDRGGEPLRGPVAIPRRWKRCGAAAGDGSQSA
jgi:pimeloyl-ACP methyl ester carboxylesterase